VRKKYKYWLIKDNFIYTTEELARLLQVHQGSIQRLINKEEMPVIDEQQKPYLIKGKDAKEFLRNRANKDKLKLEYYEFRCMKCKKAVQSIPDKVEYKIYTKRLGQTAFKADVRGVCIYCNSKLLRLSSDVKLPKIKEFYKKFDAQKPIPKTTNKPVQLSFISTLDSSLIV